jgi:energy-coupling factor transporter ATP-binding protein EcfA2
VLELDSKSMVVYGQNGAGKSSFVDAIEYVVKKGKLAHLAHEYSGTNQARAVPNTHTPEDCNTELSIRFQNSTKLRVQIARNGTHTRSGAEAIDMPSWDYRQVVLRQDEVSRFIHDTKGEKYSALLPLFGLHEMELAAENARQLGKAIEQQSQLAHKQGALSQTVTKRRGAFGDASNETIVGTIAALHARYRLGSATTAPRLQCVELEAALNERIGALTSENQRHFVLRAMAELDIDIAAKRVREVSAELAGSMEPLITQKLEVLQATNGFASRLSEEGDVECPSCGRLIEVNEFKAHVKEEQDRLQNIIAVFEARKAAIGALIDQLKSLKAALAKAEIEAWQSEQKQSSLETHLHWIRAFDPESLRVAVSEESLAGIEHNCQPVVGAARQTSENAPPDIKALSHDKSQAEAAHAVFEGGELSAEIERVAALIAFVHSVEEGIRKEIRERSEAVIGEISGDIGAMWKILHPGEPIEDIRLYLPEDDKAIDIALKYYGKEQLSPRLTLSEGYRNSLGLCIFLAMAKRQPDSDRPLFLDDVVVSFDRSHRGMIVQILEDQFDKRQVILFTHDRDWYAELRQQLDEKRWTFGALLPYETPLEGIRWSHKTTTFGDARAHIKDRPDSAANDARKIMDVELAIVAEKLQLRLTYLRGEKNDKRMAHDFLERLVGDGRTCLQRKSGQEFAVFAAGLDLLEKAGRLLLSWANRGSHSFDVEKAEATKLIDACEAALGVFVCSSCGKQVWYANAGGPAAVQCHCGQMRWRYGKG